MLIEFSLRISRECIKQIKKKPLISILDVHLMIASNTSEYTCVYHLLKGQSVHVRVAHPANTTAHPVQGVVHVEGHGIHVHGIHHQNRPNKKKI